MKPGATELGERRALTPRLFCEIPSDVCYCKYAEALYVCLAGGRDSREVELTVGWQSQGVEPARVELSGRWNSFAGDSTEVKFTCWGLQRGRIHLLRYLFFHTLTRVIVGEEHVLARSSSRSTRVPEKWFFKNSTRTPSSFTHLQ